MKNSSTRILTTHVGSLVRPTVLIELLRAKESGGASDQDALAGQVRTSVADVVRMQADAGI
ncbi:MAG TPA: methionine synthase, partial [Dehalococcoidia bacterium]|nr:methionine synthase [Dehalococcoidia bacterium]